RVISRRQVALPGGDRALPWVAEALLGVDLMVGCVPPEVVPPPLDAVPGHARVIDLVYQRPSRLQEAARARGLAFQDGVEMLVRQGARSLELWTGRTAPLEVMRHAVLEGK